MTFYTLYGTSACHLCDMAEELLVQGQRAGLNLAYDKVDIADDDALFERYGLLIPVLRDRAGNELCWPFDAASLTAFTVSAEG